MIRKKGLHDVEFTGRDRDVADLAVGLSVINVLETTPVEQNIKFSKQAREIVHLALSMYTLSLADALSKHPSASIDELATDERGDEFDEDDEEEGQGGPVKPQADNGGESVNTAVDTGSAAG